MGAGVAPSIPITVNGMPWEFYRDKVLDEMFRIGTQEVDDTIIQLAFEHENIKTRDIKMQSWSGLNLAQGWDAEGSPMPKTGPSPRWKVQWDNLWYANSTEYTLNYKTFNMYPEMNNMSKDLASTAKRTKVLLGVSQFNNGFTTNYADGVPFFGANHPLDPRVGGTYSNLVSGGLSNTTLQSAISLMMLTVDDMNFIMNIKPRFLWVHPDNYFTAQEVLNKGVMYRSDTSNHVKNVVDEFGLEVKTCPDFTNPNLWMLQGDKIGTVWNDVIDMQTGFREDEGDTFVTKQWVYFNCSCGIRDPRGFVASQGV